MTVGARVRPNLPLKVPSNPGHIMILKKWEYIVKEIRRIPACRNYTWHFPSKYRHTVCLENI